LWCGVSTRLNAELRKVLTLADVKKRFAADAAEPIGGSPEECLEFMRADHEKWHKVIGAIGMREK